jgi:hypothetical protein
LQFSSSRWCSLRLIVFLSMLLLSFSPYYSPSCPTAFLFTLLGFPLHATTILFGYSSIFSTRFFASLFFSLHHSPLFFVLLFLVCCYSLKNLVLHSFLQELRVVGTQKLKTNIF